MEMQYHEEALVQLGKVLGPIGCGNDWPGYECGLTEQEYRALDEMVRSVHVVNGWFTEASVRDSLAALSHMLKEDELAEWLKNYDQGRTGLSIGLVMAGNIPAVGFHDLLCVISAGHKAKIKLSSDDDRLIPGLVKLLISFDETIEEKIEFVQDSLTEFDAVIATGSNNTARYFEHYFGRYPHVIRKNRNSIAIINGSESDDELKGLANDVFSYFGLGCRNVTKLYLPEGYDKDKLFNAFFDHKQIIDNNKYANNYDYHKALFLMNKEDVIENGFLLMKEDRAIASPVGTLFYESYSDEHQLRNDLQHRMEEIQCVVSKQDVPFGEAQRPRLWDYADGVDTMEFLCGL